MSSPIYVVGHRNPDTDTIVSAIGYADLRRRTGLADATPARLGEPNLETSYLLSRFNVSAPPLIEDVYTRVADVMNTDPCFLQDTATMQDAASAMRSYRIVPVVDARHRLIGVVTLDDIAARYLQETDLSGGSEMIIPYQNILRTLDGRLLVGSAEGEWQGNVWVGAMQTESMARLVGAGDIVILGDRHDAQLAAVQKGVACLIIVGGSEPSSELLDMARGRAVRVIVTPHDSYRVTRLLNLSLPIVSIVQRDMPTASPDELASEAGKRLSQRRVAALPVVDDSNHLVGIISRSDILRARGKPVILVDHNHSAQAVEGLQEARLLEVVDHHNLGDLRTPEPIFMKLEPVGSTSTIVAEMYRERGLEPSAEIAGLLAGGIVSDTLLFRSPTCTPRDQEAASWLAQIAQVDLAELAQGMFRANSNYANVSPMQILRSNLKVYEWAGKQVGIGQAETVDVGYFKDHKDEIVEAIRRLKEQDGLDYMFFLATDILEQESILFLPGKEERDVAERTFQGAAVGEQLYLPGVVSRKKQVVPLLARAFGA